MSLLNEYCSLIQLAKEYILQLEKEKKIITPKKLPKSKDEETLNVSPLQTPIISSSIDIEIKEEVEEKPLTVPLFAKKTEEERNNQEMVSLIQKITPSGFIKQPITPVMLIAPDNKQEELEFLTKMGAALAPLYGAASVITVSDLGNSIFSSSLLKLLISPSSFAKSHPLLKNKAIEMTLVVLSPYSHLFTMGEISHYLRNVALKRKLWNALKALQLR